MSKEPAIFKKFINEVLEHKEFIKQSVQRDLKNKYKRSSLGYLWTIIHPLAMMVILAIVFSRLANMPMKTYAPFLFCALLPWNFFESTISMSLHSIRNNAKLFSQVPIPKYIFIISILCSNLFNLIISLIPMLLIILVLDAKLSCYALLFPLLLLPLIIFTLAFAMITALSNVFFDDTAHLSEVILRVLYFLSPILYSRELLPAKVSELIYINPLFGMIENFRFAFIGPSLPNFHIYLLTLAIAISLLYLALLGFKKADRLILYRL